MMKLLANENVPRTVVLALRADGHDVAWVSTDMPGADDLAVLEEANRDSRLLLTLDKDFGELAYRHGRNSSKGVILIRMAASSPQQLANRIVLALGSDAPWDGHFAVVDELRIRSRPLPNK